MKELTRHVAYIRECPLKKKKEGQYTCAAFPSSERISEIWIYTHQSAEEEEE